MAHETIIGRNILEMLMFSLYDRPETIYREYIQNACDSINQAVEEGLLGSVPEGMISISINNYDRKIVIHDNGVGVKSNVSEKVLKDIADSNKREDYQAGFYGIGRLVGAGYCKKLTFKTSAYGEEVASEITFDVEEIRRMIDDENSNLTASQVIDATTTFTNTIKESKEEHYFDVILENVLTTYPELLNEAHIVDYLVEVAPIDYSVDFRRMLLKPAMTEAGVVFEKLYKGINHVKVSVNDVTDIKKKYSTKISGLNEEIDSLRVFKLTDPKYGDLAWGWYAVTSFSTQIPDIDPTTKQPVATRGMRMRIHNIQLGDESFFDNTKEYFKQIRSNKYFNGEIHAINKNIKPTPERNGLAPKPEALALKKMLRSFFNDEMQKSYQVACKIKKVVETIEELNQSKNEILNTEVSSEYSQDQKIEDIKKIEAQINEAENTYSKCTTNLRKEGIPEGTQKMVDVFDKRHDSISTNKVENQESLKRKGHLTDKTKSFLETDLDINSLKKYSDVEVAMVHDIFDVIDKLYLAKNEKIMKSLKQSIIKELNGKR